MEPTEARIPALHPGQLAFWHFSSHNTLVAEMKLKNIRYTGSSGGKYIRGWCWGAGSSVALRVDGSVPPTSGADGAAAWPRATTRGARDTAAGTTVLPPRTCPHPVPAPTPAQWLPGRQVPSPNLTVARTRASTLRRDTRQPNPRARGSWSLSVYLSCSVCLSPALTSLSPASLS